VTLVSKPVIWGDPPRDLKLGVDQVHVWSAHLDDNPSLLPRLEATLTGDELARADRFVFETDRKRFVLARGMLRELLGTYLLIAPTEIRLRYGIHGKPAVDAPTGGSLLEFNLSHSNNIAVYAFSWGRELGIDVEQFRPDIARAEIARRYFSMREIAELNALPPELRTEGFFLCWTRKEAYIKAKGEGLHIPLDSFDVSLSPGQPVTLSSRDEADWGIKSFLPFSQFQDYAAALVVKGINFEVSYFDFGQKDGIQDRGREPGNQVARGI
jgi:4'-phosphopantetheinyl transferase